MNPEHRPQRLGEIGGCPASAEELLGAHRRRLGGVPKESDGFTNKCISVAGGDYSSRSIRIQQLVGPPVPVGDDRQSTRERFHDNDAQPLLARGQDEDR